MALTGIGYDVLGWIHVAQEKYHWLVEDLDLNLHRSESLKFH
jgi:hypothetical protein